MELIRSYLNRLDLLQIRKELSSQMSLEGITHHIFLRSLFATDNSHNRQEPTCKIEESVIRDDFKLVNELLNKKIYFYSRKQLLGFLADQEKAQANNYENRPIFTCFQKLMPCKLVNIIFWVNGYKDDKTIVTTGSAAHGIHDIVR